MAFTTPKTNWANGDIPTAQDFNRIEGNTEFGSSANKVLWTGTANAGDTITLNESIYNFRFAIVYFTGRSSATICPIIPSAINLVLRGVGGFDAGASVYIYGFGGSIVGGASIQIQIASAAETILPTGARTTLTVSRIDGVR